MTRILFPLLIATAALATADTSSMSGAWKIHSSISGYESDIDCTFTQTGKDLAGKCKSDQGQELAISGKLDDNKVTFQYKTQYNGDDLTVVHSGKFESPSKVVGSVDVQPMGVDGEFTATQAQAK